MPRVQQLAPWIGLFIVLALLAQSFASTPLVLVLLLAGGIYMLYQGWRIWNGRMLNSSTVVYWRGRPIERPAARRQGLPPLSAIGPALPHLIGGAIIVLAALAALVA